MVKKVLTNLMDGVNMDSSKQNLLWGAIHGGVEVVGCLPKDFDNYRRDERVMVEGQGVELLLMHFEGVKQRNSGFHYVVDVDKEGRLKSVFYCDAISRRPYIYFSDIVVFDAIYKTNKYEMKFVPFVGVNHHDQTVVFGCDLIGQERIEYYNWFLIEWMKAMPGLEHPKVIITNEDASLLHVIT